MKICKWDFEEEMNKYAFSEIMTLDETSYDQVSMEETMAVVPKTPPPADFDGTTPFPPISDAAASPTLL